MSKQRKVMAGVLIALAAGFIVYSLTWTIYVQRRYSPFIEDIPVSHGIRIASVDDFSYSVAKPSFLNFGGNLSLVDESNMNSLLVWPLFPYGYRFQIDINISENPHTAELRSITVDADGNPIQGANNETALLLLQENKDVVNDLMNRAKTMWSFE